MSYELIDGIKTKSIEREVRVAICNRCLHEWEIKVIAPKKCANCKSPYWNKERKRQTDEQGKVNKYGFDHIPLNKWMRFPWLLDENGELDRAANTTRARSLEQFMRRHNYNYATDGVMSKDPARPSGLYVMRRA